MNDQGFSNINSMSELRQAQKQLHESLAVRANQLSGQYKKLSHSFSLGSLGGWVSQQTTNICSLLTTSIAAIKTIKAIMRKEDN